VALETPNAIAAAIVVLLDDALPLGEKFQSLASSGIARKRTEFFTPVPAPSLAALYELQQPLSNDEAAVIAPYFYLAEGGGPVFSFPFVTPASQSIPVPLPTFDDNLLVLPEAFMPAGTKLRMHCFVLRIPTEVVPIEGEPLP
jgi:hypothetical protein